MVRVEDGVRNGGTRWKLILQRPTSTARTRSLRRASQFSPLYFSSLPEVHQRRRQSVPVSGGGHRNGFGDFLVRVRVSLLLPSVVNRVLRVTSRAILPLHMANPTKVSRKAFEEFDGVRWNAMNDMCALSDVNQLTPAQRAAHLAYWYMNEVENGGHYQYFLNKAHFNHDEVINALTAIGATDHVIILIDALKAVSATPLRDPQTVEEHLEGEEEADLSRYDMAFAVCHRSVFQCLEDYLDKHEEEFIEWTP